MGTGRSGPAVHSVSPDARNSVVVGLLVAAPPMRYVPTFSTLTAACLVLLIVKSPITFFSQRWFLTSSTRQELVAPPGTSPPHKVTALLWTKAAWEFLPSGKDGRLQSLTGGKISTLEKRLLPLWPPMMRATVSLMVVGASVVGPGGECVWSHCGPRHPRFLFVLILLVVSHFFAAQLNVFFEYQLHT